MNKKPINAAVFTAAYAKVNLSLDVLGTMPDGYHELCSVMQQISLCDDISVRVSDSPENQVSAVVSGDGFEGAIPLDYRNTAVRAASLFLSAAEITGCRVELELFKRIPVEAGLGGGSADAAAVLLALNRMFGEPFSTDKLREIGVAVGADVPFCITGGTMLARGRGEILSPLPPLPECAIVIVKPDFSISTAELFQKIDAVDITSRPDTAGLVKALHAGDLQSSASSCRNVFEQALTTEQHEIISSIKLSLIKNGALGAAMTGTGSAVFGIFESGAETNAAVDAISKDYKCFDCTPV